MKENNNFAFQSLSLIIGIVVVLLMTNVQSSSGSTSGSISSNNETSNNSNARHQKENTDKQMGICVVGVGGPCNGDSNWDGRDDRTGQCILAKGCGDNNGNNNQNKTTNTTSTYSGSNSNSTSSIIDGIILSK